ncbi:MAG: hypothetical protein Kow0069_31770 [Promethearchaeota archaeon]
MQGAPSGARLTFGTRLPNGRRPKIPASFGVRAILGVGLGISGSTPVCRPRFPFLFLLDLLYPLPFFGLPTKTLKGLRALPKPSTWAMV